MAGPGCPPSGLDPTRTEESLATRPGYIAGPNYLLAALAGAQLAAFKAFADGVRLWRSELLAYFDEPTTDVYADGVINKVKVIKRRAYGLPTFDGFRETPSMRLTGPRGAPARRREPSFRPALTPSGGHVG